MTWFKLFWYGLDPWIQWYVGFLLAAAVTFAIWGGRQLHRLVKHVGEFETFLSGTGRMSTEERVRGRSELVRETLDAASGRLTAVTSGWWGDINESLAVYPGSHTQPGVFLTEPVDRVLKAAGVISTSYNSKFQGAVPGLLTSLGLLGTFCAILYGLSHLTHDGSTQIINGVPELVTSLSGKFTTSIVALSLSALYLVWELGVVQSALRKQHARLVRIVEETFPVLSASHVLVDIHREAVRQTEALSNISSDFATQLGNVFAADITPAFTQGVSEGVSSRLIPSLDVLTETMEKVGQAVESLEKQKQDSVVGELQGLTTSIEQTLKQSLEQMGRQFRESLTGSTQNEFGNVVKALEGSAGVLQSMNTGFASMQTVLGELIEESRRTTQLQIASGGERAEALNKLVEGLMRQLSQSANDNATQVQAVLVDVVNGLSTKVGMLSDDLVAKVAAATQASHAVMADSVRQASDASTRSTSEVADILENLRKRTADFDKAGDTLRQAQDIVRRTLEENAVGLRSMQDAAQRIQIASAALEGTAASANLGQQAQLRASEMTTTAITRLESMSGEHEARIKKYDDTLERTGALFQSLDSELDSTLGVIVSRVQQYNQAVAKNFEEIMQRVNTTMPQMGELLRGATEELRQQVEELADVIETLRKEQRGRAA